MILSPTTASLTRIPREYHSPYDDLPPSCDELCHTEKTPYTAIILSKQSGNFLCMGSILGELHVLTAQECLVKDDIEDLRVVAGYYGVWWGRNAQVKSVLEVTKNDRHLAILKLQRKLIFSKTVMPIKLSNNLIDTPHTTYGNKYGVVGVLRAPWDVPGEPLSKLAHYELKFADMMTEEAQCKDSYPGLEFNGTTMFCTFENVTFCWGSLGSPSVVLLNEERVQVAVVIKAACDEEKKPTLHLRVDAAQAWIRSNSDAKLKF